MDANPSVNYITMKCSNDFTDAAGKYFKFKQQSSFRCVCFFLILEMLECCEMFYLLAQIVTERWNLVIWVCTTCMLVNIQ